MSDAAGWLWYDAGTSGYAYPLVQIEEAEATSFEVHSTPEAWRNGYSFVEASSTPPLFGYPKLGWLRDRGWMVFPGCIA